MKKEKQLRTENRIDGIIFDLIESIKDIGEEIKLISNDKFEIEEKIEKFENTIYKKIV